VPLAHEASSKRILKNKSCSTDPIKALIDQRTTKKKKFNAAGASLSRLRLPVPRQAQADGGSKKFNRFQMLTGNGKNQGLKFFERIRRDLVSHEATHIKIPQSPPADAHVPRW